MKYIYLIILFCLPVSVFSQFYPLEAGLVGGPSTGMNFRAYLEEDISYEALLSFRYRGAQLHLFRQQHSELEMFENGNLYLVYGYGAHLGIYNTDHYRIFFQEINFGYNIITPVAGLDGFAGVEYRFMEQPFSIGLNFKPYMELSLRQVFAVNIWDVGITVKYRFKSPTGFYQ